MNFFLLITTGVCETSPSSRFLDRALKSQRNQTRGLNRLPGKCNTENRNKDRRCEREPAGREPAIAMESRHELARVHGQQPDSDQDHSQPNAESYDQ